MKHRFSIFLLVLAMLPLFALAQSVNPDMVTSGPVAVPPPAATAYGDHVPKFFSRNGDNFKSPQSIDAFARRQQALQERLAGKGTGKIHQIASGQYVEVAQERNDRIFVIIVEYGDSEATSPYIMKGPGPRHNQIPQPDRNVDNSTGWESDFNADHYRDMYFSKMKDYYKSQSSGRYTVNGDVTEWVRVPFNGPRYGTNLPYVGDTGAWTLIADAINIWTNDQLAQGKTLEQIKAYLQTFDQWDRYDYNGNGKFDEPDGYIDHFQIVHAGAGEEAGGGALGESAIWSHRWYAFFTFAGYTGPEYNPNGGLEFGGGWGANPNGGTYGASGAYVMGYHSMNSKTANVTNAYPAHHTGIWVGDYTIQPENGGLGVFAHEYGHDLGLPDHYDTTGGANAIGFWNIMAQGSWLGDGTIDIGSKPGDMTAWDKLQLGWLNYDVGFTGKNSTHRVGPAETNSKAAQALIVVLPSNKNTRAITDPRNPPYGGHAWWSGEGDNLDYSMTRTVAVPAGSPMLTMRLQYNIETDWDYAYVSVSTDGGTSWTNLAGTYQSGSQWPDITTDYDPNSQNLGNGITGSSSGAWRLAQFPMSAYAGQTVLLRLRYVTDAYTHYRGLLVDEIALGDFHDGAELGDNGWTRVGFSATAATQGTNAPHYYIAEYRQYRGYDTTLQTGPYTFGDLSRPDMVAHYPYQDGLLITYWDFDQADDNASQHYGEGLSLPVDAHPDPLLRYVQFPGLTPFYSPWSAYVQSYDSTFGLQPTDAISLPYYGRDVTTGNYYQFYDYQPSLAAVPIFNDLNPYWSPVTPSAGVIVPQTGTVIHVVNTNTQGNFMQVNVETVK